MRSRCIFIFLFASACTTPEAPAGAVAGAPSDPSQETASVVELLKLFKDTLFNELHVMPYVEWIEHIDEYPGCAIDSTSYLDNVRFKGKRIQGANSSLVTIDEIEAYYEADYFASFSFDLGKGYRGCIVRVADSGGMNIINGIWLYVLDARKLTFVSRIELARSVGEDLYFSSAQSWIKDIDGDGLKDVITRTRNEEAGNTGLSLDADDTLTAAGMQGLKWITLHLEDYIQARQAHSFRRLDVTYP
jgi:hypothetical protein